MKRVGILVLATGMVAGFGLQGGLIFASTPSLTTPVVVGEEVLVEHAGADLAFYDAMEFHGAPGGEVIKLPPGANRVRVIQGGGLRRGESIVFPGSADFVAYAFQLPLTSRAYTWVKTLPYPVEGHLNLLTGSGVQLPGIINQAFYPVGVRNIAGQHFQEYTTVQPLSAGTKLPLNLQVNELAEISPAARAGGNLLLILLALIFLLASAAAVAGRRFVGLRESPEMLVKEKDELGGRLRADPADRETKRRLGEVLASLEELRRV